MSIPPLLAVPDLTASDEPPAGADGSLPAAPAESPAATPTDESLPPSTDDPASEDTSTDVTDEFIPTDQPDQTDTGAISDPGDSGVVNPELSALAARFSCQSYADELPDALAAGAGSCVLDDQTVLLFSFSTDQAAADYAASLTSSGAVTSDQLVQGPGYVIEADPGPIAKIKAALGAG
jgi:hypothetical protein